MANCASQQGNVITFESRCTRDMKPEPCGIFDMMILWHHGTKSGAKFDLASLWGQGRIKSQAAPLPGQGPRDGNGAITRYSVSLIDDRHEGACSRERAHRPISALLQRLTMECWQPFSSSQISVFEYDRWVGRSGLPVDRDLNRGSCIHEFGLRCIPGAWGAPNVT